MLPSLRSPLLLTQSAPPRGAVGPSFFPLCLELEVTDLGPYRAIRTELLNELDMTEMTFGWPTEMMVKTARRDARIVEVPVTWQVRNAGDSKVSGTIRGTILAAWYLLSVTIKHAGRPMLGSRRRRAVRGG